MRINFKRMGGLVPAIIQDSSSGRVLMLGYMNKEAYNKTRREKQVTFYSRSRQTLWTKGETSGNYLYVDEILIDCDGDALLIKARPAGPVCHTGRDTCFAEINHPDTLFLYRLEKIIEQRKNHPQPGSYTNRLLEQGVKRIAQKVGEEASETIIEAISGEPAALKEEAADLLYHLLVLLQSQDLTLQDVEDVLVQRHGKKVKGERK